MAGKLARACELVAEQTYQAALAHRRAEVAELRKAGALYQLALDCGSAPSKQAARAAFLEGLALLLESKAFQAETAFEDASKKDPADLEARFYRGLAKFHSGDKPGALKLLEAELPADPRTSILKVAVAMEGAARGRRGRARAVPLRAALQERALAPRRPAGRGFGRGDRPWPATAERGARLIRRVDGAPSGDRTAVLQAGHGGLARVAKAVQGRVPASLAAARRLISRLCGREAPG